jgi:bifunctional non-homologous end joining protein LigD
VSGSAKAVEVEVEGRRIPIRNLEKVFYPEAGFTKGDVVSYYVRVAPVLLPHLRGRPLTLKRYPDGVAGPFFYEKRCPRHRPSWIRTAPVWSEGNQEHIRYCVVDDLPSLVWAASIADLELHTPLALARDIDRPTALAFDLDPGPPADVRACCEVALLLRRLMGRLGLEAFPKTSGSKGLQVYVPLDGRAGYDVTKGFAHAVARLLERTHPDLVVERMTKSLRAGKVLVDWSQNDRNKTTVCAYSLRARPRPTVSTPLRWAEVERAVRTRDAGGLAFEAAAVLARVEKTGDLFAPVLTLAQRLPDASQLERAHAR